MPATADKEPTQVTAASSEADRQSTIAVDFDGVIADYDGWKGTGVFGVPRNDVVEVLRCCIAKVGKSWFTLLAPLKKLPRILLPIKSLTMRSIAIRHTTMQEPSP